MVAIDSPDGSLVSFLQEVPEPKAVKNRMHVDVRLRDRAHLALAQGNAAAHSRDFEEAERYGKHDMVQHAYSNQNAWLEVSRMPRMAMSRESGSGNTPEPVSSPGVTGTG